MNRARSTGVGALVAVALAACGSIGAPSGTVTNGANSSRPGGADPLLQLARCMRAHGVPNFPDPRPGGGGLALPSAIDPQSPAFEAAQKACAKYLPDKGRPPATAPADRRAALAFAQCMRAHGITGFPDPALTPPTHAARVLVLRGMVFAFDSGLDPKSPAFRQAMTACGIRPPPVPGS